MFKNYFLKLVKFISYLILELFFLIVLGFIFLSNLIFDLGTRHQIHFSKMTFNQFL